MLQDRLSVRLLNGLPAFFLKFPLRQWLTRCRNGRVGGRIQELGFDYLADFPGHDGDTKCQPMHPFFSLARRKTTPPSTNYKNPS